MRRIPSDRKILKTDTVKVQNLILQGLQFASINFIDTFRVIYQPSILICLSSYDTVFRSTACLVTSLRLGTYHALGHKIKN